MRVHKIIRAAGATACAVALLIGLAPPASAEGSVTITFAGDATLTGGLGYPCTNTTPPTVPDTTPTKGQKTCPPEVGPGNPTNKKAKPVEVNGDTRTGGFSSTVCAAAEATTDKNKATPVNTGTCTIRSAFVVTGYCGLSQGQGTATVSIAGVLKTKSYSVHYFWISSGSVLTLRGQAWKGTGPKPATPDWYVTATVNATPNPLVAGTSCTNKTGTSFIVDGVVEFVHPNPTRV